jgi:hypothetical protein
LRLGALATTGQHDAPGYNTLIGLSKLEIEQTELEIHQRRLELDEQERLELVVRLEELERLEKARKDEARWPA